MNRNTIIYFLLTFFFIVAAGCSSDPEGPVVERFRDGTYTPETGETYCYIDTLEYSSINLATDVGGHCTLLKMGWNKGFKFETILIDFNSDSLSKYKGKSVSEATLKVPIRIGPSNFDLKIGLYELLEPFSEDDTLSPATSPMRADTQITDSFGTVPERTIAAFDQEYNINSSVVQNWIDSEDADTSCGLAVVLEEDPDSLGFFEINSVADLDGGPISLNVIFEDDTTSFGVNRNYSIVSGEDSDELAVYGGLARRIFFEFDLGGVNDSAVIHNSELVLNVDGAGGLGATAGEESGDILGLPTVFYYYLYSPDGTLYPSFLEGKGVYEGEFYPFESFELRLPLDAYIEDIIDGSRTNTGLVLQSDLENVRFQKVLFSDGAADSLEPPRVEIIYSMPADFDGK
ncbi:MAG TPA: hypothetical protein VKO43_04510 [Candidatus Krumholzibacteriaceae bacterium]|nr:hypothetical protein [Candidatus Krumholzibacteriaceae bacterium]